MRGGNETAREAARGASRKMRVAVRGSVSEIEIERGSEREWERVLERK